ncbi:MAG: methylated-DNA--[protein]-cysteine S-methyltransferase [Cytophagales bacterium]
MSIYYSFLNVFPNQVFPKGTRLLLLSSENNMCGIYVIGQKYIPKICPAWTEKKTNPFLQEAAHQLLAYFSGKRKQFAIPYKLNGTLFQKKIWHQLSTVPYGDQISYKELANSFVTKQPIRPLANAIAKNPLLFLLPCHRIIGSDGSLKGFSAGLATKQRLLRLEKKNKPLIS